MTVSRVCLAAAVLAVALDASLEGRSFGWWGGQHKRMTQWSLALLPDVERAFFQGDMLLEACVAPDTHRDRPDKAKGWEKTAGWLGVPVEDIEEYTRLAHTDPKMVDKWVSKMEGFLKQGDRERALFCAGIAAHVIQDRSSPFHVSESLRASPLRDPWIEGPIEKAVLAGELTLDTKGLSLSRDLQEPLSRFLDLSVKQVTVERSKAILSLGRTKEDMERDRQRLGGICKPMIEQSVVFLASVLHRSYGRCRCARHKDRPDRTGRLRGVVAPVRAAGSVFPRGKESCT